jgi:hypothetical protein
MDWSFIYLILLIYCLHSAHFYIDLVLGCSILHYQGPKLHDDKSNFIPKIVDLKLSSIKLLGNKRKLYSLNSCLKVPTYLYGFELEMIQDILCNTLLYFKGE